MKTIEELKSLKEEVETMNKKLAELTEEEMRQISGGGTSVFRYYYCNGCHRKVIKPIKTGDTVKCNRCGGPVEKKYEFWK